MNNNAAAHNPNGDFLMSQLLDHEVNMIVLTNGDPIPVKNVSSVNQSKGTVWIVTKSGRVRSREISLADIAEVHVD